MDNTGPFKVKSLSGAYYSTYVTDEHSDLRYHVPRRTLDGDSAAGVLREFDEVVVTGTRFRDAVLRILALRTDRGPDMT